MLSMPQMKLQLQLDSRKWYTASSPCDWDQTKEGDASWNEVFLVVDVWFLHILSSDLQFPSRPSWS